MGTTDSMMHKPLTRALLLHTGGSFWVDVTAMQGSRDSLNLIRWLPGSPQIDLGLLPSALSSLPDAATQWSEELAHFIVSLTPCGPPPTGHSGQLAVAAAVLWHAHAAAHRLPMVRAGVACPPDQPLIVVTGSGSLVQRPLDHELLRYEVASVNDWHLKARQLGHALAGQPVVAVHVLCPRQQLLLAREAFLEALPGCIRGHGDDLTYGDGTTVRLHAVDTMTEVASMIAGLVPASLGDSVQDGPDSDLVQRLERAYERLHALQKDSADTREVEAEIRRLRTGLRQGQPLQAGDMLSSGRYQLLEIAGEGGFATVWKAYDLRKQRMVAIKVLHCRWAQDPSRVKAFFRGAREMARLRHPGITQVFQEEGRHGLHHYFVMEYVPGGSLYQAVLDGRLGAGEALACVLEVGDALEHAHKEGLLHRDIKPQNILLDQKEHTRLTDFDLVRAMETLGGSLTGMVGDLVFCAPELFTQAERADERADLYSLAMTALFALYGRNLPSSVLRQPEEIIAGLDCPAGVKKVLALALALEPERRPYGTVRAFCAALRRALSESSVRESYLTPHEQARKRIRRGWLALAALLVIAAIGMGLGRGALHEERMMTQQASTRAEGAALAAEAWRRAPEQPAESLALLRAAEVRADGNSIMRIDSVAHLVRDGGASSVFPALATNGVIDLAVAPNGRNAAISDTDGWIEIWDWQTGVLEQRIDTKRKSGLSVRYSPDGHFVIGVVRSERVMIPWQKYNAVGIWDPYTGALIDELNHNGLPIGAFDISADGRWLVTCNTEGLHLWDLAWAHSKPTLADIRCRNLRFSSRGLLAVVRTERTEIWQADEQGLMLLRAMESSFGGGLPAFSPGGEYLASGTGDTLRVWSVGDGRLVSTWAVDASFIVAFSPDGHRLVTIGRELEARLWNTDAWQPITRLVGHRARQVAATFSPDSTLLATGAFDGSVRLWNASTGEAIAQFRGHVGHIYDMAITEGKGEGQQPVLITVGQDGTLRLWPIIRGAPELVRIMDAGPAHRYAQDISSDGSLLASSTRYGDIIIRDTGSGGQLGTVAGSGDKITSVTLLSRSDLLLATSQQGLMRGWRLEQGSVPAEPILTGLIGAEPHWQNGLALSPNGRMLAISTKYGRLFVWDLEQNVIRHELALGKNGGPVLFIDNDSLLVTSNYMGARGAFGRFDLVSGQEPRYVHAHDRFIAAMALSTGPLPRVIATASHDHTAKLWDLDTGTLLHILGGHRKQIADVAISPDNRLVATASWDNTTRIWDLRSGEMLHVLEGHESHVQVVAFSPDGHLVATGSKDASVRLWDAYSGAMITVLHGHWGAVEQVRFSADGKDLITRDYRGTARRWRIEPGAWQPDLLTATGRLTNLRVCRDSKVVVPVTPFPPPDSVWAPPELCTRP